MERFNKCFSWEKANMHTHTKRCKHAIGEDYEYVEAAIKAGYKSLGFSDHAPYIFNLDYISPIRMEMSELEKYVNDINSLKEKYKNDITIYCGLEMEFFPELFDATINEISKYSLDYILLGQHYYDTEIGYKHVGKGFSEKEKLAIYVERVCEAIDTGYFDGVVHPDIINYCGDKHIFEKNMLIIIKKLKEKEMPVEVNINGLRDQLNYPNVDFIRMCVQNGNEFVIGVDAHDPKELLDFATYDKAVNMIEQQGGMIKNKLDS